MSRFTDLFQTELEWFDGHLKSLLARQFTAPRAELKPFWESLGYSLYSEGKRFRPLLSLLTAKALGRGRDEVLALATAVELIHTYSLIHDDLPCMDNDDLRRGRPTSHKVFGEATALLAGDALLTLAFGVLGECTSPHAARVVALLAKAAGAQGMVGGQVLDMTNARPEMELLADIHARKTGALIRVSVEGAAVLCGADSREREHLVTFGEALGLAFQLADDIQDYDPENPEKISFVTALGLDETKKRLHQSSQAALTALRDFPSSASGLRQMVALNSERL